MFIVRSYPLAVVLCVVTMLCWGSWANTRKLARKDWRFELFYWATRKSRSHQHGRSRPDQVIAPAQVDVAYLCDVDDAADASPARARRAGSCVRCITFGPLSYLGMPASDPGDPAGLPPVGGRFVGRERELDRVGALLMGPARTLSYSTPKPRQTTIHSAPTAGLI
jgi:hypothetical protein